VSQLLCEACTIIYVSTSSSFAKIRQKKSRNVKNCKDFDKKFLNSSFFVSKILNFWFRIFFKKWKQILEQIIVQKRCSPRKRRTSSRLGKSRFCVQRVKNIYKSGISRYWKWKVKVIYVQKSSTCRDCYVRRDKRIATRLQVGWSWSIWQRILVSRKSLLAI